MKTVFNNLSIFAVMAATVSAFAFNGLDADEAQMRFGQLPDGSWVEATPGQFSCEEAEQTCTAQLVNNDPRLGQVIEGTEIEGEFAQIQN